MQMRVIVDQPPTGHDQVAVLCPEVPRPYPQQINDGKFATSVGCDPFKFSNVADSTVNFFRLFGDSNGDMNVNNTDLLAFRQTLNRSSNYLWHFDFDHNASVTVSDYQQFKLRLTRLRL